MENPKCGMCKHHWKPEDTDMKPSGLYYKLCKTCRNKKKQYRKDNKEDMFKWRQDKNREYGKEYHKQWYQNNKERINKYNKQYWQDNNKVLLERKRQKYQKNKCPHERAEVYCKVCNFKKYVINLQRSQLRRCFKDSNLKKTKPSIEYLGCSTEYFMEYFKRKMDKFNLFSEIEMTWNNIHIDHIKPVSVFDLDNEDEFLSCCSYTNLQPLLASINLQKHDKWNDVSNDFWLTSIINNEHADIYIP